MTALSYGETAARVVSGRVLGPVADEAALALISSKDAVHLGSIRVGAGTWYYDKDSVAAGSAGSVVVPADAPAAGRFVKDVPVGAVQATRQVISGNGLTGGGDLSADRTLAVGAGDGITVNADDVAVAFGVVGEMAAAGVTSANAAGVLAKAARGDHAHAHGAQALGDGTNHAVATAAFAGFMSADDKARVVLGDVGMVHGVRGFVTSNVADLNAFSVAGHDGLTFVEGERVGLVNQTTGTEDGVYVVGTVSVGVAPLTRATDWPAGATLRAGSSMRASEGDTWAGVEWCATVAGDIVVGTSDPAFYPRTQAGEATLVAGTVTVSNVWLKATNAPSHISATVRNIAGVAGYISVPGGSRVAGAGTGSFAISSDSGADTSDVNWQITN